MSAAADERALLNRIWPIETLLVDLPLPFAPTPTSSSSSTTTGELRATATRTSESAALSSECVECRAFLAQLDAGATLFALVERLCDVALSRSIDCFVRGTIGAACFSWRPCR